MPPPSPVVAWLPEIVQLLTLALSTPPVRANSEMPPPNPFTLSACAPLTVAPSVIAVPVRVVLTARVTASL